jgi:hypothetical protein
MLPVPQIPGGLAVSIVGIINGVINAIAPQVFARLHTLGLAPPSREAEPVRCLRACRLPRVANSTTRSLAVARRSSRGGAGPRPSQCSVISK